MRRRDRPGRHRFICARRAIPERASGLRRSLDTARSSTPGAASRNLPLGSGLNERVARRLRALGGDVEVVRLRQPVDLDVFTPLVPLVIRPSRVRIPPSSADSSESPAQSGLFVGLHTRRAFGSVTHQTCGWREIAVCGASSRSQVDRTLRPFGGVASSRHRTAYESRGSAHDLAGVRRVR